VAAMFAIAYGSFRFFIEFFRQPDQDIGYIALDWLTMGQLLSAPMVIAGLLLLYFAYKRREAVAAW
jgi:phosphatidylglycerol:prolipoprotein diacylglycerol transferase